MVKPTFSVTDTLSEEVIEVIVVIHVPARWQVPEITPVAASMDRPGGRLVALNAANEIRGMGE